MLVRTPKDLGHVVRDRRTTQGLTQAALAARVGVSRKWIIDLEAGKAAVDLSLVLRTLRALGVELDARVGRDDAKSGSPIDLDAIVGVRKRPAR